MQGFTGHRMVGVQHDALLSHAGDGEGHDPRCALALNLHANLNVFIRRELITRYFKHRFGIIVAVTLSGRDMNRRIEADFAAFQCALQARNNVGVSGEVGKRFLSTAGVEENTEIIGEGVMQGNDPAVGCFHEDT